MSVTVLILESFYLNCCSDYGQAIISQNRTFDGKMLGLYLGGTCQHNCTNCN